MNRIGWVDFVKGMCISLVVLSHITGVPFLDVYLFADYVMAFYFLSGMVFKVSAMSTRDRIIKRVKKLIYLYLKYSIIVSAAIYMIDYIEGVLSYNKIFENIIGLIYSRHSIVPNGPPILNSINSTFWFVTSLIVSYLYFELLIFLFRKRKTYIILIIGSLVVSIVLEGIPFLLPWSIDTAPFSGLIMFVGYQINQQGLQNSKKSTAQIILMLGTYIFLCSLNSHANFSIKDYGSLPFGIDCIVFFFISIIGTMLFVFLAKYMEKTHISKIFIYIGKNSIYVLFLHLLVVRIYYIIIEKLNMNLSGVWYWLNAIICTSIAILIPLAYEKAEELCKEKIHVKHS